MDETPSSIEPRSVAFGEREKTRVIFGAMLLTFLAALDQMIVAPALPVIAGSLGHADYLPWVVTAYLIAATAVAPLYGKLADTYGRRPIVFTALGIFLLGSIACAIAPTMLTLVIARGFQGVGGGALFALSQTIIGDMVPPRERARYAAWFSAVWAAASISGPMLGGVFAQHFHWSLIFWINVPIIALVVPVIWKPLARFTVTGRSQRPDILGAILLVFATLMVMLALTWGGSRFPWLSLPIFALFAASAVLWGMFALHLLRTDEPLISLPVLRNPVIRGIAVSLFLTQAALIGLAVYLPVYLQSYQGVSVGVSGIALIGLLLSSTAGSFTSSSLTMRIRRYQRIPAFGLILATVSLLLLAAFADTRNLLLLEVLFFCIGYGVGTIHPVASVAVQAAATRTYLGVASGIIAFVRALGSSFGVALLGAVALSQGVPLAAEGHSDVARELPSAPFSMLFLVAAGAMALATVMWWLTPEKPLSDLPPSAPSP